MGNIIVLNLDLSILNLVIRNSVHTIRAGSSLLILMRCARTARARAAVVVVVVVVVVAARGAPQHQQPGTATDLAAASLPCGQQAPHRTIA